MSKSTVTKGLFYLLVLLALAIGGYKAYQLMWYNDDIFITLRYIKHWLQGQGIVYNPGELVEGYTHFLWLLIITALTWLTNDWLQISLWLGWASLLGVIATSAVFSWKVQRPHTALVLPFSALLLALHHDFLIWATGGLETMFYTLLLCLLVLVLFLLRLAWRVRLLTSGALLLLLLLTRPDASLFVVLVNFFVVMYLLATNDFSLKKSSQKLIAALLWLNLPLLLVYLPYLGWKYYYYGSIIPNTYYAKAAYNSYYDQGFKYIASYLDYYKSAYLLILPAIAFIALSLIGKKVHKPLVFIATHKELRLVIGLLLFITVYGVFFVAKVGGDYMFARFLIPLIPLLFFMAEASLAAVFKGVKQQQLFTSGTLAAVIVIIGFSHLSYEKKRERQVQQAEQQRVTPFFGDWIVDARFTYINTFFNIRMERELGEELKPYFEGLRASVLSQGQGAMVYYADFYEAIEFYGLTDEYIARKESVNEIPGHRKEADLNYLRNRNVNLYFNKKPFVDHPAHLAQILLGEKRIQAEIITYDAQLMNALKDRLGDKISFFDTDKYVKSFVRNQLNFASLQEVQKFYDGHKDFYFAANKSEEINQMEQKVLQRLSK